MSSDVRPGRVQRVAQLAALIGVAALLSLLIWKVAFGRTTGAADELAEGKLVHAPAFTLDRLDREGQLSVADLKGKAVVVNFWASWCVPCRDEAGLLQSASTEWRSRGVVVLGIDHQDLSSDARAFMRHYRLKYPVVHDAGDKLYQRYGATGVPETFCVNRDGKVVAHVPGAVTRDTLDSCIQGALES